MGVRILQYILFIFLISVNYISYFIVNINMEYIENLHRGYDGYNLDFEINDLQADMIAGIVSYKVGYRLSYDDISVLEIQSTNDKIVGKILVHLSGLELDFFLKYPD